MTARAVVLVAIAFALTRAGGAWLADHPEVYGPPGVEVTGDPEFYSFYATRIVRDHARPYAEVAVEYPPGSLPFIVAPEIGRGDGSYRTRFIALMVAIDAAAFASLVVLARRWGSARGPWLWVLLPALLGPISLLRLDLVPAAATVWAIERASAGSWGGAGALFGLGAVAKIYPGLLVPAAVAAAPARRRRALAGAAVAFAAAPVAALAPLIPGMVDSVAGYHGERGIQVESTWGAGLLAAARTGYDVVVAFNFGAFHVDAGLSGALEIASLVLTAAVVAAGVWVARRARSVRALPLLLLATLAALLTVATVFSPQYILWLAALGAAAACSGATRMAVLGALLAAAAALSHAVYPWFYNDLLDANGLPVALVAARNALVAAVAVAAFVELGKSSEEPHAVGVDDDSDGRDRSEDEQR